MSKIIDLSTKDTKTLVELMFRGLAYTDAYYSSGKRMKAVWDKVIAQLSLQGGNLETNGEIKFKR